MDMHLLPFRDRADAARLLARALDRYRGRSPLVLAIPRGGVPVGRIVADALGGTLDVVLVRKLGAPGDAEYAIGAVDERGTVVLSRDAAAAGADDAYVRAEAARQQAVLERRSDLYRGGRAPSSVAGRTVIVVDDGLATGATMAAALRSLREQHPARLVCAIPVAAGDSLREVGRHADETVCLATPVPFHAVGLHYREFGQVSDGEVVALLSPSSAGNWRSVQVPGGGILMQGDLGEPVGRPIGVVLFAHGSGSSRLSPRNRHVAEVLQAHGMSTLLLDLLTPEEDVHVAMRFDIALLSRRLGGALAWLRTRSALHAPPLGLFGASIGAAAALAVAAEHPGDVAAVVSRGGRPDLVPAGMLEAVRTPSLLIVGGEDTEVLAANRQALARLGHWGELTIVPRATHLFEEPGALDQVARLAAHWFEQHFRQGAR